VSPWRRPIGVVRQACTAAARWLGARPLDIIVREELSPMLEGIDGYSHVIVVFAFHRVPEQERRERVRPRGEERIPNRAYWRRGASCGRIRSASGPPLLKRRKNILRVEGLDDRRHARAR
jgi:hypothetical protein